MPPKKNVPRDLQEIPDSYFPVWKQRWGRRVNEPATESEEGEISSETGTYIVTRPLGEEPPPLPEVWSPPDTRNDVNPIFLAETYTTISPPEIHNRPDAARPGETRLADPSQGLHPNVQARLPFLRLTPTAPHTRNSPGYFTHPIPDTTAQLDNRSKKSDDGSNKSKSPPEDEDGSLPGYIHGCDLECVNMLPNTSRPRVDRRTARSDSHPGAGMPSNAVHHGQMIYGPANTPASYSNPLADFGPTSPQSSNHTWLPSYDPSLDFISSTHPSSGTSSAPNPENTYPRNDMRMYQSIGGLYSNLSMVPATDSWNPQASRASHNFASSSSPRHSNSRSRENYASSSTMPFSPAGGSQGGNESNSGGSASLDGTEDFFEMLEEPHGLGGPSSRRG